jgi:hypothetical protein
MPNPFDPGRRQVIDVNPENAWRATEQPLDLPWPSEERTYFLTTAPASWMYNETQRAVYATTYGDAALGALDQFGLVEEHMNPVNVGGTYWRDPKKAVRPVFKEIPKDKGSFSTLEERVAALETYVYNL